MYLKQTKTYKIRKVDLHPDLVEALRVYFGERDIKEKETGKKYDWVFCDTEGQILGKKYIRLNFKRCIKESNVREIRFHDMRHTYASLLLSKGVSPTYVKEQLGHGSLQMVYEVYGHWIPTVKGSEVDLLIFRNKISYRNNSINGRDVLQKKKRRNCNHSNYQSRTELYECCFYLGN